MTEKSYLNAEEWSPPGNLQDPEIALEILRAVRDIHYGSVEVIVHDGRIVQIERKEKIRFAQEKAGGRK
jgi:hypothetical protein